jgi:lipopolysaccharide/colanic/teichoic acid biosynthesis glycosyltransferase
MLRRFKIDELPQFWNVLTGQMSLVGPRPNVAAEVAMYTELERALLETRPGITDLSSIVFADLGEILEHVSDANREYNLKVRPWKSRLGLHYIANQSLGMDAAILALTALSYVRRKWAREGVAKLLVRSGANTELVEVARRISPLTACPPPGATESNWEAAISYR